MIVVVDDAKSRAEHEEEQEMFYELGQDEVGTNGLGGAPLVRS